MRTLRPAILWLLALACAAGCARERSGHRELTAPLGPVVTPGDGPNPPAPVLTIEPEPTPQFQIRLGGAATAGGTGMGHRQPEPAPPTAREVHFGAVVIDTHVDTPQAMADEGFDLLVRNTAGHLDLPRMREGGLDAAFFSIWVDPREYRDDAAYERALRLFETVYEVDWRSLDVTIVDQAAELERVVAAGETAMLFGVEGGHALGTDDEAVAFERLRLFRALGARYLTITWSNDNPFGHASTDDHPERGLTEMGRHLIAEMERIGVVVDVSHISDQTFWDIMAIATRPVLASHSSARALADHPRNMTDEMIRAVGAGGGAVCVNYYTGYIDQAYAERVGQLREEHPEAFEGISDLPYLERGRAAREAAMALDPSLVRPTIATVADHIMHVVELAGPDAACLGSDFDGIPDLPVGLDDVSGLPGLTEELRARGLSDPHLVKILGANVLRVLSANEPETARRREGGADATGEGTGLGTGAGHDAGGTGLGSGR